MTNKDKEYTEFCEICKPVIKYLNNNNHPHTKIIIDCTWWELFEWIKSMWTNEFLKD